MIQKLQVWGTSLLVEALQTSRRRLRIFCGPTDHQFIPPLVGLGSRFHRARLADLPRLESSQLRAPEVGVERESVLCNIG